ncbi:hypothetical protein IFVP182_C290083 [Vibrio parahaemolyticus]
MIKPLGHCLVTTLIEATEQRHYYEQNTTCFLTLTSHSKRGSGF